MKNLLLIVLLLSVGFSQQLIRGVDTDEDGTVKINYYKETQNGIEKVKYEEFYSNGQKEWEVTYKDGTIDGLLTGWYENGQKCFEHTYKDGVFDGLITNWWDNGQKSTEVTWKDGEFISSKCWDKDGNEIDCKKI